MIHTLHTFYTAVWANFWTPSAPTLAGIAAHYVASQIRHEKRHAEQMAAIKGGEQQ
jgi:hypothetical protein